ncbi:hypothetical protein AB5I41_08935 [Sphingomonas sp. MMS24-JH45]
MREDYPYASVRLHRFILGASCDLMSGCRERGLACAQHVDRAGHREKGLVHRLGAEAAAVVLEDQPTFVARWQAARVADRADVPVYAVDGACLVPPANIGGCTGRTAFLLPRAWSVPAGCRLTRWCRRCRPTPGRCP